MRKVYLNLNLTELHVGKEILLLEKLLKTELDGSTLDLIKQHKQGQGLKEAIFGFSLVVSENLN
jgi:hypothetical protein